MADKRKAKAQFKALREAISQAVRKADPIDLIKGGAPDDEYDPEIGTVLPRLSGASSVADVRSILHEQFVLWFGADLAGNPERYDRAAGRIWALLRDNAARLTPRSTGPLARMRSPRPVNVTVTRQRE